MDTFSKLLEDTITDSSTLESRLIVMNGPEDGRVFSLTGASATIGRLESNAIALTLDRAISRKHAQISREGDFCFVEDLNSTYGVEVQGERIRARRRLADRDMLRVGETELMFRSAGEKQE